MASEQGRWGRFDVVKACMKDCFLQLLLWRLLQLQNEAGSTVHGSTALQEHVKDYYEAKS